MRYFKTSLRRSRTNDINTIARYAFDFEIKFQFDYCWESPSPNIYHAFLPEIAHWKFRIWFLFKRYIDSLYKIISGSLNSYDILLEWLECFSHSSWNFACYLKNTVGLWSKPKVLMGYENRFESLRLGSNFSFDKKLSSWYETWSTKYRRFTFLLLASLSVHQLYNCLMHSITWIKVNVSWLKISFSTDTSRLKILTVDHFNMKWDVDKFDVLPSRIFLIGHGSIWPSRFRNPEAPEWSKILNFTRPLSHLYRLIT